MVVKIEKDAIGAAMLAYLNENTRDELSVMSDISEDDIIPLDYLFRDEKRCPDLERKALDLCKGKVLDVGAGSGVHSIILQSRGLETYPVEVSPGAVEVMKKRGVKNVRLTDFKDLENEQYDTILLLMNGIGLAGTLDQVPEFLNHCDALLADGGQVLLDSSDIKYMFEEEDGSYWMDLNKAYYGEVTYQMKFRNIESDSFSWLYLDFEQLNQIAEDLGWTCELLKKGDHHDFLVRLSK